MTSCTELCGNNMKAFCPNCEAITAQEFIQAEEYILVNNELISVHLRYYICLECGEDYEIPSIDYDPLADAYLKLGLRTNEELTAIVNVLKIAMNIKEMRQWLNQADYG